MTAGQIPIAASATAISSSANLSGDVTSNATLVTTLATVNANVGTFQGLTLDAKGRVTAAVNQSYVTGGPFLPLAGGQTTGPVGVNTTISAGGNASTIYGNSLSITSAVAYNLYLNAASTAWLRKSATGWGGLAYIDNTTGAFVVVGSPAGAADSAASLSSLLSISNAGLMTVPGGMTVNGNTTISKRLILTPSATNVCDLVIQNTNGAYLSIYNDGQPHIYSSTNQIYLDSFVTVGGNVATEGSVLIPNNSGYASKDSGGNVITLLYIANNNAIYIAPNGNTTYVGGHMVSNGNNTYLLGNAGNAFSNVVAYAFTNPSDIRDKAEIETLPDCLGLVQAIEPKRYKFTNAPEHDRDRIHWGFVAQEVAEVMETAGHAFGGHMIGDDEKQSQALRTNDLVAVLWKACQELTERIKALEDSGGTDLKTKSLTKQD